MLFVNWNVFLNCTEFVAASPPFNEKVRKNYHRHAVHDDSIFSNKGECEIVHTHHSIANEPSDFIIGTWLELD